jgi:hypothetical protein
MPFGLKNVEATYQWCMQDFLKEQLSHNIEVYIDDIVIKTTKADISMGHYPRAMGDHISKAVSNKVPSTPRLHC